MSTKPPSIIPKPKLQFTLLILILLASFLVCPAHTRPSVSADGPYHHHHHVHQEDTDTMSPQSEDTNIESQEKFLTELKTSEEQEFQEESGQDVDSEAGDTEDYLQQDMPVAQMGDAVWNSGGRRGEVKLPKSHHHSGKHGRRHLMDHHSAAKPAPAANDTNDGVPDDLNVEELNKTLSSGNVSSSTVNDEDYKKISKNNRESQEFDHADRNKALRINEIKGMLDIYRQATVVVQPRPTIPTNVPIEEIVGRVDLNISHPSPLDAYPMKRRSFHPSCSLPNNTDVDMWANGNSMNLWFNLTYPTQQNATMTIIAATLRLYKFPQGNHTLTEQSCSPAVGSSPDPDNEDDEQEALQDNPVLPEAPVLPATPATVMADDDKQIRVSVYWYTRSLKKNKVKRKLLDSRMLPLYGRSGWIEFNVRHAARQWRLLGKNFGLVVEVENEDGELMKATDYFTAMNCSNEASTARPLPGVLLQAARSYLESLYASAGTSFDILPIIAGGPEIIYNTPISSNSPNSGGGKTESDLGGDEDTSRRISNSPYIYSFLFPVIDICTVEIPAQEAANAVFLLHTQYVLTQHLSACKNRNKQNRTDVILMHGAPTHRIRAHPMTVEVTDKTAENQTEELNNVTRAENEDHQREHRHNMYHATRLATREEIFPSMRDSPQAVKIRHSRHHVDEKHRQRNQSGNRHFEETMKRRIANGENERESEEIKEQVTWTDENGHEFRKKVIIQEVIRSANPRDTSTLPQTDSDR